MATLLNFPSQRGGPHTGVTMRLARCFDDDPVRSLLQPARQVDVAHLLGCDPCNADLSDLIREDAACALSVLLTPAAVAEETIPELTAAIDAHALGCSFCKTNLATERQERIIAAFPDPAEQACPRFVDALRVGVLLVVPDADRVLGALLATPPTMSIHDAAEWGRTSSDESIQSAAKAFLASNPDRLDESRLRKAWLAALAPFGDLLSDGVGISLPQTNDVVPEPEPIAFPDRSNVTTFRPRIAALVRFEMPLAGSSEHENWQHAVLVRYDQGQIRLWLSQDRDDAVLLSIDRPTSIPPESAGRFELMWEDAAAIESTSAVAFGLSSWVAERLGATPLDFGPDVQTEQRVVARPGRLLGSDEQGRLMSFLHGLSIRNIV